MTTTLVVQIISLIIAIIGLGVFVYAICGGFISWMVLVLPIVLFLNMTLFLAERVLFKFGIIEPNLPDGFINNWAVSIQLMVVLFSAVAVLVRVVQLRKNGR